MNLIKNVKIIQIKDPQTAATSAVESDAVDTSGYEGVLFVGSIAVANAGNYAEAQQGDTTSPATALAGTKVVTAANHNSFALDVYKPTKRYLRCVVTRTASSATGALYAILYNGAKMPTTQGAGIDAELHVSPAEGTP
jgi:hypothetical protein